MESIGGMMSKSDLLYEIQQCKNQEELVTLWKTLTSTEQKAYKGFFTEKKKNLGIESVV